MPWASKVKAIVQMWLPGGEGGHAIADILTGKVNPSGKLPVTFPKAYEDNPTYIHFPGGAQADYGEGIFVGYRYYAKTGIKPLFPFGHGLSYTQFELSEPALTEPTDPEGDRHVSVTVANTGDRAGAETVQLYVEMPNCPEASAPLNLCAFEKIYLEPGARQSLSLIVPKRAFAYFDEDANDWTAAPGPHQIHLATSAANIQHSFNMAFKE
ncbi:MAG: beta-D-glucoside glucohydrolase, partial [Okeania sp. SIO3C4]|nr:beta-D-glucoside glucohydrolase [Okeania sp. SIO3C4]